MSDRSETKPPADEGRLDRRVRPVGYVQRMGSYQGVPAYGCLLTIEAERHMKVNDPLYDKAALDAAVAAALEAREFVHAESSRIYARLAGAVRAGADDTTLASLLRSEVNARPNVVLSGAAQK